MKKQDLAIVLLLFALMLAWPTIYRKFSPQEPPLPNTPTDIIQEQPAQSPPPGQSVPEPESVTKSETAYSVPPPEPATSPQEQATKPALPEQRLSLTNAFVRITVSSRGGSVVSAELTAYRESIDQDSGPVMFDFSVLPSLSYSGLPGFSALDDFDISLHPSGSIVRVERTNAQGLHLTRTISLGENYQLAVNDIFSNQSGQSLSLPQHLMQVGPMPQTGTGSKTMRQYNFGIDALLSSSGEGVKHWAAKLPKFFKTVKQEQRLARLPEEISIITNTPVDWVAAKDKFFVQILASEDAASGYIMCAKRCLLPGEGIDSSVNPKNAEIDSVSVSTILSALALNPDQSLTRNTSYYVGPKKLSILKHLGLHQDQVMDFGWWTPVCKILLTVLNATYSFIPNYGVAIILLTILIRIVFWPLTHKSTESMKKMQALQPEMTELRKKYKDNPKMMQAETMALYKKNKVNPMSGCLPMIIQIPVFIALFVVLRSAIELRFADFLWIRDLSEPEGLLAGILPFPKTGLNILPVIMAVTMVWQQKLMPTSDPNQQKIMTIFMPAMMLVMFYNMPSALVLYWSASQCIMIAQQLIQKQRAAGKTVNGS